MRGALTEALVFELLQHFTKNLHHEADYSKWAIFGAALRKKEWQKLQVQDYNPKTNILHLRWNKAANATNGLPNEVDIPILDRRTHEALVWLQATRRAQKAREHELLMPRKMFPYNKCGKLVKRCHTDLGWNSELSFDGFHCLRHGGMQHMQNFVRENEEARNALLAAAHVSEGVMEHYCEEIAVRVEKSRKRMRENEEE